MKAQLLVKYRKLITKYQNDSAGFTLIELMVVIAILGVLTAIGTNAFLNEIPKAKQAEAKTTVAHINSAQSTYWLKRGTFANTMNDLALGLQTVTSNYTYNITGNTTLATVNAIPASSTLKGYVGVAQQYLDLNNSAIISSIICEAAAPGNISALPTSGQPGTGACGTDVELGQ